MTAPEMSALHAAADLFRDGARGEAGFSDLAADCGLPLGWPVVHYGVVLAGRMTQRKPRWLVEVSTACAIRAAGR